MMMMMMMMIMIMMMATMIEIAVEVEIFVQGDDSCCAHKKRKDETLHLSSTYAG